jgi:hypothetical protein
VIAVRIPKEIRDYKEKLIFGLNLRQLIATVLALGMCVPLYLFGRKYVGEDIISWVVIVIALPLVSLGFFRFNGMVFEKFVACVAKQMFFSKRKRLFKSANFFRNCQEAELADEAKQAGGVRARKAAFVASMDRARLMEQAEADGKYRTPDNAEQKPIPQGQREGGKPQKHGPQKGDKPSKAGRKMRRKESQLRKQAIAIKQKQRTDPHYVLSAPERHALLKWGRRQEQLRAKEAAEGRKDAQRKNKEMQRRRKTKSAVVESVQDSIPYIADYDEGMFESEANKYSKVYSIKDINYLVAKQDEQVNIFVKYGEFLNYFSEDMNVAICIDNRVISLAEQEQKIFYPYKGDGYDSHREEYNRILRKQIRQGRNNLQQSRYVVVTLDCDSPYEALMRFHKIDTEIVSNLKKIGSDGRPLSTEERLAMLHDKFRKGSEGDFRVDFDFLKKQGLSSKDYIAPSSMKFEFKHFMIEDEYYRCLYLNNLPASLSDTFMSELTDCDFPLVSTINIQPVAQEKGLKLVRRQLTGMEANKIDAEKKAMSSGYSPETISHDLRQSLDQASELLDDLINKNQKMFFVTITFMVSGRTPDELEENCKILVNKARKFTCQLQTLDWQQEEGFRVTLPCGVTPRKLSVERTLTTESTSIFMPFTSQELFQPGGFYYGLNQISRNLILCDRTGMKTPSGFILGSSGSGKSFATKREILNVLLKDNETNVIVIDPENEYGAFARAFGGTVIDISADSSFYINPMDMESGYGLDEDEMAGEFGLRRRKEKALQRKSDYLMSIVECMISVGQEGQTIITPQQKTIVDRCVRKCYEDYLSGNFDERYLPTLVSLQEALDAERFTEDGRQMAEGIEYYTRGSMNIFSHRSNVEYNNRFVVFNIRDLGTQLKQIALLIVLDFIWNRMIRNSSAGIRTYCYCDEIHLLFQNEYSARFLQQLYKRGRKYGLVITGITQNMEDLLQSDTARSMIANSDFLLMLNQAYEDLKILASMLHISEAQMSFVSRAEAGCGLLFAEKTIVPFVDRFPPDSYLYRLMSTKFAEEAEPPRETA